MSSTLPMAAVRPIPTTPLTPPSTSFPPSLPYPTLISHQPDLHPQQNHWLDVCTLQHSAMALGNARAEGSLGLPGLLFCGHEFARCRRGVYAAVLAAEYGQGGRCERRDGDGGACCGWVVGAEEGGGGYWMGMIVRGIVERLDRKCTELASIEHVETPCRLMGPRAILLKEVHTTASRSIYLSSP